MFVSIRGIQRYIKKITLSQHDDAVLTKNRGNEKFGTFFMTVDSSRRNESNDTNIDMVFFRKVAVLTKNRTVLRKIDGKFSDWEGDPL